MEAKHGNAFLSGGGVGDWFKKAFDKAKSALNWGLEHKGDLMDAYKLGKKLTGKGTLLYNRDIHPKKNMDLFYE